MSTGSNSNEWRSPAKVVKAAARVWGPFDFDPAAAAWNAQAPRFLTRAQNGLRSPWLGRRVWLNPPYTRGNLLRWLGKARGNVLQGLHDVVVCLVPTYPSETWWQQHVARPEGQPLGAHWLWGRYPELTADARRNESIGLTVTVLHLPGRLRFTPRRGRGTCARFGSSLVVFEGENA